MNLRFGLFDQLEYSGGEPLHQVFQDRLKLIEMAEAAGAWGWHKSEHHMIPLDVAPSINVFLAAAIERTSRIRICSLVHLLPFYHPMRLAEELCMLDHLSHGRLEIGFGKGISSPEHILWGLPADEAIARTDETLEILIGLFTADGHYSFEGQFHSFDDAPVMFDPYQDPYPPLWRPGTIATAAELGVRTVTGGPMSNVTASVAEYREKYNAEGVGAVHEPMIGGIRRMVVAPTDAEADAIGRRAWAAFSENLPPLFHRFGLQPPNDPTVGGDYDKAKEVQAVLVGSPSTINEHLAEFEEVTGTDYFIGGFAWGDLSADEFFRSFDLFAEHCMGA